MAPLLVFPDVNKEFILDTDVSGWVLEQRWPNNKTIRLKLQPRKCHLLQSQVQFLGHIVSIKGVSPDPQKVKQWPTLN